MFYCEIDEAGFCYHTTTNKLPLNKSIILSDENQLGKVYENGVWVEYVSEHIEEYKEITGEEYAE